jgi:osmotically-inducible protein OsmY
VCRITTDEQSRSARVHIGPICELDRSADDTVGRAHRILMESRRFRGRTTSLKIAYSNGVLTIAGCVPSFYLKQLLQELLKRVDGVQYVDNQVDVVAGDELSRLSGIRTGACSP